MTLTDADALAYGHAALALLDLAGEVRVSETDPHGDKQSVEVELGDGDWREFVQLGRGYDGFDALHRITDQISEYISESRQFWGIEFPRCPGHRHAAALDTDADDVVLRCPQTGAEIRRVTV